MAGKVFRASSHQEALASIRAEFGADAVILSTRQVPPPAPGLAKTIEILAVSPKALKERQAKRGFGSKQKKPDHSDQSSAIQSFAKALMQSGVNGKLARQLLAAYEDTLPKGSVLDPALIENAVARHFQFGIKKSSRRTLAVVGPTGVGKTTTIAKLAGQSLMGGRSDLALITTDTHRVGATEQLKNFASLYRLPFRTAGTARELHEALDGFSSHSLILIDTAGCGPRDKERLDELQGILAGQGDLEVMLLLPASGNSHDLVHAGRAFAVLEPITVGVTKTDETAHFGPCLNVLDELTLPIVLFGTGQNVPEDLEPASAESVTKLLLQKIS